MRKYFEESLDRAQSATDTQLQECRYLYSQIQGYAKAIGSSILQNALEVSAALHAEQKRRSGAPYIIHPMHVCFQLISVGCTSEEILSVALLHDTIEDCNVSEEDLENLGFSKEIATMVRMLSKNGMSEDSYLSTLTKREEAVLVKLADRFDNTTDLAQNRKKDEYIAETYKVLSLTAYCFCYKAEAVILDAKIKENIAACAF